ncbi:hypothetical protein TSL6_10300 [Sulfurovum sp. TSL6]|nr:hypothetical protein TSL6_10300 [Sulfurovum sp. TSL6]
MIKKTKLLNVEPNVFLHHVLFLDYLTKKAYPTWTIVGIN